MMPSGYLFCYVNLAGGYDWLSSHNLVPPPVLKNFLDEEIRRCLDKQRTSIVDHQLKHGSRLQARVEYRPSDVDDLGRSGLVFVVGSVSTVQQPSVQSATLRSYGHLLLQIRNELAEQGMPAEVVRSLLETVLNFLAAADQPEGDSADLPDTVPQGARWWSSNRKGIRGMLAALLLIQIVALLILLSILVAFAWLVFRHGLS